TAPERMLWGKVACLLGFPGWQAWPGPCPGPGARTFHPCEEYPMKQTTNLRLPLVLALAAALSASPALAQQKGKGPEKKRERPELVRRQKGQSEKAAEARRKAAEKEQKARAKEL